MKSLVYNLSERFFELLLLHEQGVEPILIVDQIPKHSPLVAFPVRYVMGEGGGGESRRPIFKSELTAYDFQAQLTYPTQNTDAEQLLSIMKSYVYGSSEALMSRAIVQKDATGASMPVEVIVSEELVSKLIELAGFKLNR